LEWWTQTTLPNLSWKELHHHSSIHEAFLSSNPCINSSLPWNNPFALSGLPGIEYRLRTDINAGLSGYLERNIAFEDLVAFRKKLMKIADYSQKRKGIMRRRK